MNEPVVLPGRSFLSFSDVVSKALGDISRLKIVDIGCGTGTITRKLAELGASVMGVDPNAASIEQAQQQEGGPRYRVAHAEELGLPDGGYDVAFFSNSLHHIPDMPAALAQAYRIVRTSGRIAVMEPESPDPLLSVMRFIDDETDVYRAAQKAVRALAASGGATLEQSVVYASKYRVDSAQEMVEALLAVDSSRSLNEADRPAFEAAFDAAVKTDEKGGYLESWQRVDVLRRV